MKLAFRCLSFDIGHFATRRYVLFKARGQADVGKTVFHRNQLRRITSSFGVHHIRHFRARVIAVPADSTQCLFGVGALVVGAVITALGAPGLAIPQRRTAAHHLSDPSSAGGVNHDLELQS